MSDVKDFVIENGVLVKYTGSEGDIVVPEGVTEIGSYAFSKINILPDGREWLTENYVPLSVTLADSVEHIDNAAFAECKNLHTVVFSANLKTIGDNAFARCSKLENIILPNTLESIGCAAFFGHMTTKLLEIHSNRINLPERKLSIFQNPPYAFVEYILFAPHLSLSVLKSHGLAEPATKTFISRHSEYDTEIYREYIAYISSQKKKYLPFVLNQDEVDIIKSLYDAGKITQKNFEKDYLLPAKQTGASKCEEFLMKHFSKEETKSYTVNDLWNGINFSLDGKQLIKYAEVPDRDMYYVPDGTKEIMNDAFFMTSLRSVYLPESVTTVRNGAFVAKGGIPLFVKLPNSLKKLPLKTFLGGFWSEDDGLDDSTKYYYISTSSAKFAEQASCSSYSKGNQCPVYTGGPLDDLSRKTKPYAVKGFLYATEHNLEDMSNWKDSYLNHIKRNEKTYLKLAENNGFLVRLMISENLLSENGSKTLLENNAVQNDTEIKALLLNYHENIKSKKSKQEIDPLADDSPEMQKLLKAQTRRKQIKYQDGIAGIIFVASGNLENFGYVNEYTGAHDLSDLKRFIEARGGFLRSAVSSKTDYLICNDTSVQSTKVQKAKELGTVIITEEEFVKMAK